CRWRISRCRYRSNSPYSAQFTIDAEVEILNVGRAPVRGVHRERIVSSAIDRNRAEYGELLRYRHREIRQRQVTGLVIGELTVTETAEGARQSSGDTGYRVSTVRANQRPAGVAPAIARAEH